MLRVASVDNLSPFDTPIHIKSTETKLKQTIQQYRKKALPAHCSIDIYADHAFQIREFSQHLYQLSFEKNISSQEKQRLQHDATVSWANDYNKFFGRRFSEIDTESFAFKTFMDLSKPFKLDEIKNLFGSKKIAQQNIDPIIQSNPKRLTQQPISWREIEERDLKALQTLIASTFDSLSTWYLQHKSTSRNIKILDATQRHIRTLLNNIQSLATNDRVDSNEIAEFNTIITQVNTALTTDSSADSYKKAIDLLSEKAAMLELLERKADTTLETTILYIIGGLAILGGIYLPINYLLLDTLILGGTFTLFGGFIINIANTERKECLARCEKHLSKNINQSISHLIKC